MALHVMGLPVDMVEMVFVGEGGGGGGGFSSFAFTPPTTASLHIVPPHLIEPTPASFLSCWAIIG